MFIKCKVLSGTEGDNSNYELNKGSLLYSSATWVLIINLTMCQIDAKHTE